MTIDGRYWWRQRIILASRWVPADPTTDATSRCIAEGPTPWRLQDAFTAKTLGLASGTIDGQSAAQRLATTQSNLGIGFVIADLTAESTIDPDADLLGFADVSASDPEERKATIEEVLTGAVSSTDFSFGTTGLMELAAAEAFDIHDDVSPVCDDCRR